MWRCGGGWGCANRAHPERTLPFPGGPARVLRQEGKGEGDLVGGSLAIQDLGRPEKNPQKADQVSGNPHPNRGALVEYGYFPGLSFYLSGAFSSENRVWSALQRGGREAFPLKNLSRNRFSSVFRQRFERSGVVSRIFPLKNFE